MSAGGHLPHRWWFRDVVVALIVGVVISAGSVIGQKIIDDRRADRDAAIAAASARHAERLENVVFVRAQSSPDPNIPRPFGHLDLAGMTLVGLQLPDADFAYANLADTTLASTDFSRGDFSEANLTNADLRHANLTGARLSADLYETSHSSQDGADLTHANLAGTDLTGADLRGTVVTDVFYDATTRWPAGYQPPPSRSGP